jgi:hypothetical protein
VAIRSPANGELALSAISYAMSDTATLANTTAMTASGARRRHTSGTVVPSANTICIGHGASMSLLVISSTNATTARTTGMP